MAPRLASRLGPALLCSGLVLGLAGCTVGAPAAGTSAPDPTTEASGPGSALVGPAAPTTVGKPGPAAERMARWTIFVYANGDNGRSPELAADLARMNEATLGADVDVIVFADWNAALTDADGHPFPTGSQWISLPGGGAKPRVQRANEHDEDLDDPAVLRSAVSRAFGDHPAHHHGLIVWARGEGGDTQDGTRDGAAPMSTPAMASAIRDGLADVGLTGERALDLVGFDSYAPPRIEVAYAMRDLARVYIANPAGTSGTTWAYADALGFLAATPEATGKSFAEFEAYAARKLGGPPHVAVQTDKLESLAAATAALVQAIAAHPEVMPSVLAAMTTAASTSTSTSGRHASYARFVTELARRSNVDEVSSWAEDVAYYLAEATVPPPAEAELGFTLPSAEISPVWLAEYAATAREWLAATRWDVLLAALAHRDS